MYLGLESVSVRLSIVLSERISVSGRIHRISYYYSPNIITVKFIYFEKATKFTKIFTLLLTTVHTVKSKVKILQNVVAFSEFMNFKNVTKGL